MKCDPIGAKFGAESLEKGRPDDGPDIARLCCPAGEDNSYGFARAREAVLSITAKRRGLLDGEGRGQHNASERDQEQVGVQHCVGV